MGISFVTAVSLSAALSLLYVLVIYTHKEPQTSEKPVDRNDPTVIKSRITKISLLTISTIAILPPLLSQLSNKPLTEIYAQFGILPGFYYQDELKFSFDLVVSNLYDTSKALLLVSILYIGPLIDYVFIRSNSPFEIFADFIDELSVIQGLRDLLIGPLTEEIVYTSSIIVILYQVEDISIKTLIMLPPVFFSFAHIHHAIELFFKNYPINMIIISTTFQMLYTFLFGIFTNFVFLRTGNTWACVLAHSFCNFMGVPNTQVHSKGFKQWNYVYYFLIILGIYGFKKSLFPLTESETGLVQW